MNCRHFPRRALAATVLSLFAASGVHAQAIPDAGRSLRDIERAPPAPPPRQPLGIDLPDAGEAPPAADGRRIAVRAFRFGGNTVFGGDELAALTADLVGRESSLAELQEGMRRIARLYREHGYPLARVWLPPQEVVEGVVRVEVLEGRYGEVRIGNRAGLRESALAPLAALRPGDLVAAGALERSLLLTRDLNGVEVEAALQPGASVGATDLSVEVSPGRRASGGIEADNFGNRYTGEYRLGVRAELNNPLGLGDQLSVRALGTDERQIYGRIGWQGRVGPWATQVGAAYAQMHYELGKDFADLDASGRARIVSVWAMQPLVRSRDFSLFATVQFDGKRLRDDIDLFGSRNPKRSRAWSATLSGNGSDALLGGGLSSFSLAWSRGELDLDDADRRAVDAATARTQGRFHKLDASLARWQRLAGPFSLYGQLEGQWADGNLDGSEKMTLGGAHGVRAYPQGEAAGDQGWLARLEVRYAFAPGWQLAAFADHGEVRSNKDSWAAGRRHRQLSGTGLGVSWADGRWSVQLSAAWKIGSEAAESGPERSPRGWIQMARQF
ncbi:MAG: ShlB/FhaC/HecB family hemolysin secretion/activation protein [Rhodocyclaceae bacterium]|nr:ShlB/FhaC/HecB family hemolysin secretion/activation protein [Rhodocyclaceae bacterium]